MTDIASVLFSADEIRGRVIDIAGAITRDYEGRSPILVGVLKGSSLFLSDLIRAIRLPVRIDFMSISSFGGAAEKSGRVRIVKDMDQDIGDQDVIMVEDIVDTGLTAAYLLSTLQSRSPRSLEVCTLLDKSVRRIAPLQIKYRGFDCPDRFVVGYGLDIQEMFRNLPDIFAVEDSAALADDPSLLSTFVQEALA
jgi:hypoxanthine phosphoribosyltransferase